MSLLVQYPHGGRHLLLHWYTYHERGHVVLVPTTPLAFGDPRPLRAERNMAQIARRLIRESEDIEFKAYGLVEMLAPSAHLIDLHRDRKRADDVYSFHGEIVYRMKDAAEAGLELPAPFSLCDKYNPEPPEDGVDIPDDATDEYGRERHYGCRDCKDRIRMSVSPEDLFDRYAARWRADEVISPRAWHVEHHERRGRVESRARPMLLREPFWYALARFGDHSSGIELHEADYAEAEQCTPAYLGPDVLFYFRKLMDFGTTQLEIFCEDARAEHVAERKKREQDSKANQAKREKEARDHNRAVIQFFKESP